MNEPGASQRPGRARARALADAGAGVLLFAAGLAWSAAAGIGTWDESWFLQVVARVRGGEALYREVFFGATPLGVALGVTATGALGVEAAAIKAARVACFVAAALLAGRLSVQLTGRRRYVPFLLGACFLYAPPDPKALYSPLAEVLLLGCASLALARRPLPIAAGLCAGLCLAAKQNTGALALAALVATLPFAAPAPAPELLRRGARLLGACAAALLLALLPVAASGALAAFADQGLWGKQAYLARAGIPFGDGLRALVEAAGRLHADGGLARFFVLQAFALPFAAALAALAAVPRASVDERRGLLVAGAFAAAALASAFPRADLSHVRHAVPALLVLAIAGWDVARHGAPRWARPVEWAAAIGLAIGLAALVAGAAAPIARGERVWSTLPHLRGALLDPQRHRQLHEQGRELAEAAGAEAFLVSPRAGLLYLVSGVRNPTPYDWPGLTSMGRRGEVEVIDALARGALRTVCLDPRDWELRAPRLERAVREHLVPVAELGACTLYRAPGG
ncbi:MAG TPA: hypothetical protein VLC53_20490 [Myxococcota bacterium]|nr:hypothetical protein [Myxococcota bacterium]